MIKRESDWISIALFGSVYVAIKVCCEPLPDDGEIDTGLAFCAYIVNARLNAINRTAIALLSLKEARDQKTLMSK
jgi:hypothetical protein